MEFTVHSRPLLTVTEFPPQVVSIQLTLIVSPDAMNKKSPLDINEINPHPANFVKWTCLLLSFGKV